MIVMDMPGARAMDDGGSLEFYSLDIWGFGV